MMERLKWIMRRRRQKALALDPGDLPTQQGFLKGEGITDDVAKQPIRKGSGTAAKAQRHKRRAKTKKESDVQIQDTEGVAGSSRPVSVDGR